MTNQCTQCGADLPDVCPVCKRRVATINQTPYTPEDQRWLAPVRDYAERLEKARKNGFDNLVDFIRACYWQWESSLVVGRYLGVTTRSALMLIKKSGCEIRPQGGANFVGKGLVKI